MNVSTVDVVRNGHERIAKSWQKGALLLIQNPDQKVDADYHHHGDSVRCRLFFSSPSMATQRLQPQALSPAINWNEYKQIFLLAAMNSVPYPASICDERILAVKCIKNVLSGSRNHEIYFKPESRVRAGLRTILAADQAFIPPYRRRLGYIVLLPQSFLINNETAQRANMMGSTGTRSMLNNGISGKCPGKDIVRSSQSETTQHS